MPVSRDDVRRIAGLARVGVPEERIDALVAELSGILSHMDVLAKVDTRAVDDVEREGMPLARDEPGSVPLNRPREEFAPQTRDGFFLVPRLSTHEDGEGSA
jgi:aspartyl-tRNA(Asn)/glutamyl-tRNA(Gln) amidotransferase subunit C